MLSKPCPTSSAGKFSVGSKSTPRRSRTVFLYSRLLSRRMVTRPGSGGAVRSCSAKISRTCETNSLRSCCFGWSASFGGITPFSTIRRMACHLARAGISEAFVPNPVSESPASGSLSPWQSKQCCLRNSTPSFEKSGGAATVCCATSSDMQVVKTVFIAPSFEAGHVLVSTSRAIGHPARRWEFTEELFC